MLGAIIGDVCGSIYEFNNRKTDHPGEIELKNERCFFTDDTVLTCAVAEAVLGDGDYKKAIYKWANDYPFCGYGGRFRSWFTSKNPRPYNSWGNGSAMRTSPIGWAFDSIEETLNQAKLAAEVTHNHPKGIKGAQAVAAAIFLARTGKTKDEIAQYIETAFNYNVHKGLRTVRPGYQFNESCQGTVPEAVIAFMESGDFESAIQNAISLGGDSDTLACITGGIAEAYYNNIPDDFMPFLAGRIPLRIGRIIVEFYKKFIKSDKMDLCLYDLDSILDKQLFSMINQYGIL
jgi:ADP-ribosylglycohydrolase